VFYGGSTVDAGSLQIGSSNAAQTITVNGAVFAVSGTASIAAGSTLSMYGGSFTTQGGLTDSGTISGAGTIGGPLGGTGTVYAESGTLDLTGTVASGLTFEIASYGDLKIDGTANSSASVGLSNTNQVLEIGSSGSLTINAAEQFHAGYVNLDGGTLTDSQGFYFGGIDESGTVEGFGTVNGNLLSTVDGAGLSGGLIRATGGTLTINGDVDQGNTFTIAAGATLVLNGSELNTAVNFIDETSGTLVLPNAAARESFESTGLIENMNFSANGAATNVLDLADVSPTSITSAIFNKPTNTIELFSGSTMIDHFALNASPAAGGVVHWTADSGAGTNIFLSTT
jgi:fibronectin-binding autotransporter adhesin